MKYLLSLLILLVSGVAFAQVEMVPPSHPVYGFLKRMQVKGIVSGYNSSNIPISREEIGKFLSEISANKNELSSTDKKIIEDYFIEFENDISGTLKNSNDLFERNFEAGKIFENKKQKYLYSFKDSNASFFLDGIGSLSYRQSSGDSLGFNRISLGEIGFRMRGTFLNSLGFYIRASNGAKLSGDNDGIKFAGNTDPKLRANTKFYYENKNFDSFEGYLRYRTNNNIFALTVGKEAMNMGFGYIDKLYLSNNTVPFTYGKMDLKYKAISYSFVYGSLKGDSLGRDLSWKSIALHRLNIKPGKVLNIGFYEAVVFTSTPFSWVYLNPLSFLTSADLNMGSEKTYENNTFIGIDFELTPVKNLAFQGSVLIDDLNFETIGKDDVTSKDNKFGYQIGGLWSEAFMIPNISLAIEYTRLDPFVYTHRSNKNTYTNWGLPLGHNLQPNSDEIALKLSYDITNRIHFDFLYQFQRSGGGYLLDSLNNIIRNYGGDINRGDFGEIEKNKFLQGFRTDRNIFTINLLVEPIKQYFLEAKFYYRISDLKYLSKTYKDFYFWLTARVDY